MTAQVLVINLDRSIDRLTSFRDHFSITGLPFSRIAASDGAKVLAEGNSDYCETKAYRHMGRLLLPGEVGCYLSHIEAAQVAATSEHPFTVVLEDDARVVPDIAARLDKIEQVLPQEIGIVNLGRAPRHLQTEFPMTATGLLWRKEAAQEFLASTELLAHPVDVYLQLWATRLGNGAALRTPIVSPADQESVIFQGRRSKIGLRYTFLRLKRLVTNRINQRKTVRS